MSVRDSESFASGLIFYRMKPQKDLRVPANRVRALFITSGLPREQLVQIWNFVKVGDEGFTLAEVSQSIALIQTVLRGNPLPTQLPQPDEMMNKLDIPTITESRLRAYELIYDWMLSRFSDREDIDAPIVLKFLLCSQLQDEVMARIWNFCDVNRDGKICFTEFLLAVHLTVYSKTNGSKLEGSIDVYSVLPRKSQDVIAEKENRLLDLNCEKEKLLIKKEEIGITSKEGRKLLEKIKKNEKEQKKLKEEIYSSSKEKSVGYDVAHLFDKDFLQSDNSTSLEYVTRIQSAPKQFSEPAKIFERENIVNYSRTLVVTQRKRKSSKRGKDSKRRLTTELIELSREIEQLRQATSTDFEVLNKEFEQIKQSVTRTTSLEPEKSDLIDDTNNNAVKSPSQVVESPSEVSENPSEVVGNPSQIVKELSEVESQSEVVGSPSEADVENSPLEVVETSLIEFQNSQNPVEQAPTDKSNGQEDSRVKLAVSVESVSIEPQLLNEQSTYGEQPTEYEEPVQTKADSVSQEEQSNQEKPIKDLEPSTTRKEISVEEKFIEPNSSAPVESEKSLDSIFQTLELSDSSKPLSQATVASDLPLDNTSLKVSQTELPEPKTDNKENQPQPQDKSKSLTRQSQKRHSLIGGGSLKRSSSDSKRLSLRISKRSSTGGGKALAADFNSIFQQISTTTSSQNLSTEDVRSIIDRIEVDASVDQTAKVSDCADEKPIVKTPADSVDNCSQALANTPKALNTQSKDSINLNNTRSNFFAPNSEKSDSIELGNPLIALQKERHRRNKHLSEAAEKQNKDTADAPEEEETRSAKDIIKQLNKANKVERKSLKSNENTPVKLDEPEVKLIEKRTIETKRRDRDEVLFNPVRRSNSDIPRDLTHQNASQSPPKRSASTRNSRKGRAHSKEPTRNDSVKNLLYQLSFTSKNRPQNRAALSEETFSHDSNNVSDILNTISRDRNRSNKSVTSILKGVSVMEQEQGNNLFYTGNNEEDLDNLISQQYSEGKIHNWNHQAFQKVRQQNESECADAVMHPVNGDGNGHRHPVNEEKKRKLLRRKSGGKVVKGLVNKDNTQVSFQEESEWLEIKLHEAHENNKHLPSDVSDNEPDFRVVGSPMLPGPTPSVAPPPVERTNYSYQRSQSHDVIEENIVIEKRKAWLSEQIKSDEDDVIVKHNPLAQISSRDQNNDDITSHDVMREERTADQNREDEDENERGNAYVLPSQIKRQSLKRDVPKTSKGPKVNKIEEKKTQEVISTEKPAEPVTNGLHDDPSAEIIDTEERGGAFALPSEIRKQKSLKKQPEKQQNEQTPPKEASRKKIQVEEKEEKKAPTVNGDKVQIDENERGGIYSLPSKIRQQKTVTDDVNNDVNNDVNEQQQQQEEEERGSAYRRPSEIRKEKLARSASKEELDGPENGSDPCNDVVVDLQERGSAFELPSQIKQRKSVKKQMRQKTVELMGEEGAQNSAPLSVSQQKLIFEQQQKQKKASKEDQKKERLVNGLETTKSAQSNGDVVKENDKSEDTQPTDHEILSKMPSIKDAMKQFQKSSSATTDDVDVRRKNKEPAKARPKSYAGGALASQQCNNEEKDTLATRIGVSLLNFDAENMVFESKNKSTARVDQNNNVDENNNNKAVKYGLKNKRILDEIAETEKRENEILQMRGSSNGSVNNGPSSNDGGLSKFLAENEISC